MPRGRRMVKDLIAVSLIASIAACGAREVTEDVAPDKIRAVVLPFLTASPFHIAAAEGYFEEQNLDVEFVKLARNIEAIPALARGDVDVGFGQLTITLVNAIASGARLRLVAGTGYLDPDGCTVNGVAVRRALVDSGRLSRPEDLRGLKVELDVLVPAAYYVDRLLQPAGLSIDDLDIVNLPTPSNVDALIGGTVDMTVVTEPYLTRIVQSGEGVMWKGSEQIVPDFQLSSVLFGPNFLDERPEVGKRFMVAFRKGMEQYDLGKTPRNLEIIAQGTGRSVDLLQDICWPRFRKDGRVGVESLITFQEWLDSRDLIDRIVPEEELLDTRFVDHANAVLNR